MDIADVRRVPPIVMASEPPLLLRGELETAFDDGADDDVTDDADAAGVAGCAREKPKPLEYIESRSTALASSAALLVPFRLRKGVPTGEVPPTLLASASAADRPAKDIPTSEGSRDGLMGDKSSAYPRRPPSPVLPVLMRRATLRMLPFSDKRCRSSRSSASACSISDERASCSIDSCARCCSSCC